MPLFDQWRGTGTNAEYRVYTFAAFNVTGYCFGPGASSTVAWPGCADLVENSADKGRNIRGTFVRYVDLGAVLEFGGPSSGVYGVRLELP